MDIRLMRPSDIPHVQQANITNLPENYFLKYYLYHTLAWPQLSYVAVDVSTIAPSSYSPECWQPELHGRLAGQTTYDPDLGNMTQSVYYFLSKPAMISLGYIKSNMFAKSGFTAEENTI
jgi:hypothetical protein